MPTYTYETKDGAGQVSRGQIDATSIAEASAAVRAGGRSLVHITPAGAAGPANLLDRVRGFRVETGPGLKDVMNFTNQLAVMIKAGINIRTALDAVGDQIANTKFQRVVQRLKEDVEAGQPFSDALAKHPKVFPPLYVNMVRASELSGNFAHMLNRIAQYLRDQIETRNMVIGAMVYPAIIGVMAVGTTIFLLAWVLPKFTALFAGKEHLLPTPTLLLMGVSDFLRTRWYVCLGGVAAAIGGFLFFVRSTWGRPKWDAAKLRIPLFARMLRALYISRGLQTMGELVNAGVPMLDTLRITGNVSGNARFEGMWRRVHQAVEQGEKIAKPLEQEALLPSSVVQMVSAGEESGNLGEVLRDVADFYNSQLKATIKAVTAMIEPLMIVVMGFLVGFIAMSIILPIFKMSSLVK
jgi:type IV pilus assembly protein PilC